MDIMDSSLQQLMHNEGLVPSSQEEIERLDDIGNLKEILSIWIGRVAYRRSLPYDQSQSAYATILPFGSYALGAYHADSDIDVLCVAPCYASMEDDFFGLLYEIVANSRKWHVSGIHCVKDAKVPLIRFKLSHGISIDMAYARLLYVPRDVNLLLDPSFLSTKAMDETSWNSLKGVLVNQGILQSLPDMDRFRELLRCVKLWAKRRGVYGNLFGFFGGVHLASLAAFICHRNPCQSSLTILVAIFFKTFASWPWPKPVLLEENGMPQLLPQAQTLMPIQLPGDQQEYCHSNMTISTFRKIKAEFQRAYRGMDLLMSQSDWSNLFEPFPYSKRYNRFVRICVSTSKHDPYFGKRTYKHDHFGDWVGRVKSRFRWLLVKLEREFEGLCDPNPIEYFCKKEPNETAVAFYWGVLGFGSSDYLNLQAMEQEFMNNLSAGYEGHPGQVSLSIIQESTPRGLHGYESLVMSDNWDTALVRMKEVEKSSR